MLQDFWYSVVSSVAWLLLSYLGRLSYTVSKSFNRQLRSLIGMLRNFTVRWYLNTENEASALPYGEVMAEGDCTLRVFKLLWSSQSFKGKLFHMRKINCCTSTVALVSEPALSQLSLYSPSGMITDFFRTSAIPFFHFTTHKCCTMFFMLGCITLI